MTSYPNGAHRRRAWLMLLSALRPVLLAATPAAFQRVVGVIPVKGQVASLRIQPTNMRLW
ncbi:hypothetical protein GGR26_002875 [Lewinella marina]|uniref:Uncharacterized protein n=1 Tax=Neolewinella marina TaxID=438751 RepID=A0A2G0CBN1_9BACT|nr:hypothetical protein [Neolewinella marina]NJB87098.1 hypothetical protein [Neolewinella marina]PHK97371.1 hypothetical protein CGL56_16330 [Neolewinella marina]